MIFVIIWGLYYNIALFLSFETVYPEKTGITGTGEVISIKEEKEYYDKYIVKVKKIENIHNSKNTKLIIYVNKYNEFDLGDVVQFKGEFSKGSVSRNYRGFNYRTYLKQSKIHGTVMIESINRTGKDVDLLILINQMKQKAYNKIEELYKYNCVGFLKGILLGNSNELDNDVKEDFKDSNISHILAISGMHVSYVIFGIDTVLNKIINSKRVRDIIKICILIFFAIITGLTASCVRACIMTSMIILSSIVYRKNNFYISMLTALIIIVVYNPYNLFNVGMWLSFAGALSIFVFNKFFQTIIKLKFKNIKPIFRKIIDICILSISAQILITPIMLYSFSTISLTFFISNALIYYLIGPILILGYISVFIGFVFLKLGNIISFFETNLINVLIQIADICGKIPFSKIHLPTPNLVIILLYYFVVFLILKYVNKHRFIVFRIILRKRLFKKIY